ncbi:hypothetical protein ACVWZM_005247 [Bradyrhizobium sp. USDA 4501]
MANGNNVNFANGCVYATQNASSNWGGLFYGPANYGDVYGQAGASGVYGSTTANGYGVFGNGGSQGVYGTSNRRSSSSLDSDECGEKLL